MNTIGTILEMIFFNLAVVDAVAIFNDCSSRFNCAFLRVTFGKTKGEE